MKRVQQLDKSLSFFLAPGAKPGDQFICEGEHWIVVAQGLPGHPPRQPDHVVAIRGSDIAWEGEYNPKEFPHREDMR